MAAADRIADTHTLHVGEGVAIKDAVVVADTIVVDGVLEGDITVVNLVVSKTGTISGRIGVTHNAEICGKVFEKLDVKGLLLLRAGGRVDGNVSFGTLTIEQGATITGAICSTDYRTNQQSHHRAGQQSARPDSIQNARSGNTAASSTPLDLSVLDLMPGPIAATA